MSTGLLSARLEGVFRKQRVVAYFQRQPSGDWRLVLTLNGAEQPAINIHKRSGSKPCWSVACDYLDGMVPGRCAPSLRAIRLKKSADAFAPRIMEVLE